MPLRLGDIEGVPDQIMLHGLRLSLGEHDLGYNHGVCDFSRVKIELDVEKLNELIQDINFESYGFSNQDVAAKTAQTINSALPSLVKVVK